MAWDSGSIAGFRSPLLFPLKIVAAAEALFHLVGRFKDPDQDGPERIPGKLGADMGVTASVGSDAQADILQALVALGYSDRDAALALKALPRDVGVSDGIKLALRALAK